MMKHKNSGASSVRTATSLSLLYSKCMKFKYHFEERKSRLEKATGHARTAKNKSHARIARATISIYEVNSWVTNRGLS